ncbi:TetR/AcrR family transcriptional regulator [Aminobacter carboxidus]|uniref:AcrR family transcriptional regulator n=1 Tax=Aminobacter carboxidus TaxID=376165 RepID=A0A8E1WF44_9HYPH|nr:MULTISPECIES: TetR/AcrR family transcriptional regulator [Aminobacter carboxidus group]MBB6467148.1 AcrR family transcriptional regulator [Aminobacter lissarensis]MBE1207268.1 TetR/AcrR family transcriptional regulator [Aminobacter carboxidus]
MSSSAAQRRELQKAELRAELVAAAHALVREEGYDGLTIRKLATRVGYAPMSVYSYFADKQEILMALAEDAFADLAQRMRQNQPEDPITAMRAALTEYAEFGLGNPNEYRTVFMTEKQKHPPEETFEQMERENPAFQIIIERVQACIAAGVLKGDARAIATALWTVAHGSVSLLITFPFYPFGDPKAYVMRMGDLAMAGLAASETPPLTDEPGMCPG